MKRKFSKVFFVIVMLLIVSLLAVACNNDNDDNDNTDPVEYTVTYVGGDGAQGTAPNGGEYAAGATFTLPGAGTLSKTDYSFGGWSYGGQTYAVGATFTMPANAVQFTAVWTLKNQIVQFDTTDTAMLVLNLDENIGFIEIANNNDTITTVNFTYTLNGTAIAITLANNGGTFNGTLVEDVLTVNITYNTVTYQFKASDPAPTGAPTVSFDTNGGTGTAPEATVEKTANGYKVLLPANPFTAPANKQFKTWEVVVDDESLGTYKPNQSIIAHTGENVIIKAIWEEITIDVISGVTYIGNCTVPITNIIGDGNGNGVKAGGQTYTKFVISISSDSQSVAYLTTDSAELKQAKSVQMTTLPKSANESATPCLEAKMADGINYYIVFNADNTKLTLYSTKTGEPLENGVFTKQVPQGTVAVTFDPNNEGVSWSVDVVIGETVNKPANDPVISSGKVFRYWKDDETGAEFDFSKPVTTATSLTAVYNWQIVFKAGEGATGTVPATMWTLAVWNPGNSVLPNGDGLSNGTKTFGGWSDGTNTYQAGDYLSGSKNYTLTAVWKNGYSVTFTTAFRGEGTAPATMTDKQAGDVITLPQNTFTAKSEYSDYVFAGWKVGNDTTYKQPNETFEMPASDVTVMAMWVKDTSTTYSVTYKAGEHGTGADVVVNNVNAGNYKVAYSTFTADNFYTFIGWKVQGDNSDDVILPDANYTLSSNVVFVAQYLNAYQGYDNGLNSMLILYFDTNEGVMYIDEDEVMISISVDDTNITLTPQGGTACNGTFANNTLNIVLTVNGTDYTFGNPSSGGDNPEGPADWVKVTNDDKSDFMNLGSSTATYYFPAEFENGGVTFIGVEFSYDSNLGTKMKPIYYSNGSPKVGTSIGGTISSTNSNYFEYSSGSYNVVLGKKSDGKYYIVSFSYKNNPDTTERELLAQKPAQND